MLFIVLYFVFLSYLDERRHAFPYQSCGLNRSQNLNMEHALGFVGTPSITIKMTHILMLARSILKKKIFFSFLAWKMVSIFEFLCRPTSSWIQHALYYEVLSVCWALTITSQKDGPVAPGFVSHLILLKFLERNQSKTEQHYH